MVLAQILEVSKPRIVVLLVITAVTSLYAAETLFVMPDSPNYLTYVNIIIVGAVASAGSSALNHYYDRDIDPAMTRTSKRPIPSGSISPTVVLVYGLVASCASVIYAFFALNPLSAFFTALGVFFYVIIYTVWLKRRNISNIVIGGFAGSAASMAGWAACMLRRIEKSIITSKIRGSYFVCYETQFSWRLVFTAQTQFFA